MATVRLHLFSVSKQKKKVRKHLEIYSIFLENLNIIIERLVFEGHITTENPDIEACRLMTSPISRNRTPGLTIM